MAERAEGDISQNNDESATTFFSYGLVQVVWTVGLIAGFVLGALALIIGYTFIFLGAYVCGMFSCCFSCFENSPFKDMDVVEGTTSAHSAMWDSILSGETLILVATACVAAVVALVGFLSALATDRDSLGMTGGLLAVQIVVVLVLYAFDGFSYAAYGLERWTGIFGP